MEHETLRDPAFEGIGVGGVRQTPTAKVVEGAVGCGTVHALSVKAVAVAVPEGEHDTPFE